jgi:hypothetical protein
MYNKAGAVEAFDFRPQTIAGNKPHGYYTL